MRGSVRLQWFVEFILLSCVYFVTAKCGLAIGAVSGFATLVWAPTGIALAALLMFGNRLWPAITLAAFLVNLSTGAPALVVLGMGIGNTLEAVIGASLLRRSGFRTSFATIQDVLKFIVLAALFSTFVSGIVGVTSLWLGGM